MLRTFLISFLVFSTIFLSQTAAQKLGSKEYEQLIQLSHGKKIVGLGEPEHFFKSYYTLKSDILKEFVKKGKVTTIAFEASMSGMKQINNFIHGEGDIEWASALRSLNQPYEMEQSGLFDCEEMVNLFTWLKKYNESTNKKIRVVGIDFQNHDIPAAAINKQLVAMGHSADADKVIQCKTTIDSLLKEIVKTGPIAVTKNSWISKYKEIRENLIQLNTTYGDEKNEPLFRKLIQYTSIYDDPKFPRDSMMYANLKQVMTPDDKVLVWAANFHLENDVPFAKVVKKLGVFLKETYAEGYFNIGLTENYNPNNPRLLYPQEKPDWDGKYDLLISCQKSEPCVRL